jgi:hypothetical protein
VCWTIQKQLELVENVSAKPGKSVSPAAALQAWAVENEGALWFGFDAA